MGMKKLVVFHWGGVLLAAVAWLAAASSLLAQDPQEVWPMRLDNAKSLSTAFRKAAEATMPSVVTLVAYAFADQRIREFRELLNDPRFRRLLPEDFDPEQQLPRTAESILPAGFDSQVGSGIVIDSFGSDPDQQPCHRECGHGNGPFR
jgi:hypothetical protein